MQQQQQNKTSDKIIQNQIHFNIGNNVNNVNNGVKIQRRISQRVNQYVGHNFDEMIPPFEINQLEEYYHKRRLSLKAYKANQLVEKINGLGKVNIKLTHHRKNRRKANLSDWRGLITKNNNNQENNEHLKPRRITNQKNTQRQIQTANLEQTKNFHNTLTPQQLHKRKNRKERKSFLSSALVQNIYEAELFPEQRAKTAKVKQYCQKTFKLFDNNVFQRLAHSTGNHNENEKFIVSCLDNYQGDNLEQKDQRKAHTAFNFYDYREQKRDIKTANDNVLNLRVNKSQKKKRNMDEQSPLKNLSQKKNNRLLRSVKVEKYEKITLKQKNFLSNNNEIDQINKNSKNTKNTGLKKYYSNLKGEKNYLTGFLYSGVN